MLRILYRVLFVLFILSGLCASAQPFIAIRIVVSTAVDDRESIELDLDERGFSFDRRWRDHAQIELALQKYAARESGGAFEAEWRTGRIACPPRGWDQCARAGASPPMRMP